MDRKLQAGSDNDSCTKIMLVSTGIFLVLYIFLIVMIIVMIYKYKKQKKEIEESHLVPGATSEQDEWLLVNKLVNEMKQNSGKKLSLTNPSGF